MSRTSAIEVDGRLTEWAMDDPPRLLDGATVVRWAISRSGGFYQLAGSDPPIKVVAMAVCRYGEDGPVYLFKCDTNWQVVQDWDCGSVEEAAELAEEHACGHPVDWRQHLETGAAQDRPRDGR
ncbi:MAG TPA: hypothetical protein VN688_26915 [Gemmataceae bacterium]|nr:hypothetical protein [Gemmataceae bacterium]